MRGFLHLAVGGLLVCGFLSTAVAQSATSPSNETDALDLKSAAEEQVSGAGNPTRMLIEGAMGRAGRRDGTADQTLGRVSLDLLHTAMLGTGWRAVLSDRIDTINPVDVGNARTTNSLREAYVGWNSADGSRLLELGRINLRNGPAYGYNPTDFFRDGALRVITSANPFSLRENRLGTVMLRGQVLWPGGSASLALAPKLANHASEESFSLDLGATNRRNRALLSISQQWSERLNGQLLLYKDGGLALQTGASLSWLASDSVVAHAELAYAKGPTLADAAWQTGRNNSSGTRMAGGLTYTTPTKLSITVEGQANELALKGVDWNRAYAASPGLIGLYLSEAARRQDLASRRAFMVYLNQRDLAVKNLELTALLRTNLDDHSHTAWVELRHHWSQVDLAVQWQVNSGRSGSEYLLVGQRHSLQVIGSYHFN